MPAVRVSEELHHHHGPTLADLRPAFKNGSCFRVGYKFVCEEDLDHMNANDMCIGLGLYNKFYQTNLIDARGLMIYGLIHCHGSKEEKQDVLVSLNERIRSWVRSSDKVGKFNYEDILCTILWFATQGELQFAKATEALDI